MPIINVVKSFLFPTDAGLLHYDPGEYDVDEDTASHWFVQAHLEGYQEPEPSMANPAYSQIKLAMEQAVRQPVAAPARMEQPRAPLPPNVIHATSRNGAVPEGAHYFAGQPQVDKPLEAATGISFLSHNPS